MGKQSALINVWKPSCTVLSMQLLLSGPNGWLKLNIGTTPLTIVLWIRLPLRCSLQGNQHSLDNMGESTVPDIQVWLQERAHMNEILHQQLVRAQQRIKNQADKHRSERQFVVGDQVYLKLQPYVQMSVAHRSCHKLSFRYFWALYNSGACGSSCLSF
jgi:hypothetical protein